MIWLWFIGWLFLFIALVTSSYLDRRTLYRLTTRKQDVCGALATGLLASTVIILLSAAITYDFAELDFANLFDFSWMWWANYEM